MATDVIYFETTSPAAIQFIEKYKGGQLNVAYWSQLDDGQKENALEQAKYLITAAYPVTRQLLEQAPNVKLVQKTGSGVDNIDLDAAKEQGILVSSTPGANSNSVAEMTIGMILCLYRKLHFLDKETKQGKWLMFEHRPNMYEMRGKVHGIIGMGNIGKEVSKLSQALGTKIIYYDAYRLTPAQEEVLGVTYVDLSILFQTADIISVHVPLLPGTRGLVGAEEMNRMKPSAILVNVARGNIVDETALSAAVQQGKILGAGLDTFALEPVRQDNPLFQFDNVLVTPHIAGGTRDVLDTVLRLSFDNIRRMENGELPINIVKTK
ncbi:MAG TPA: 2-hydroxyacid dehydrogenase [Patescibacteria group bacterium]|nr:2-hydroxyacid dehydrogenase [Patescibacteria group bacterium]